MKQSFKGMAQKGFTLLELLVVITLLAVLSVGALVAYEGIGDTAQATAAARNIAAADQSIRNFRAVTQNYPNQFDNLVVASGTDENGTAVALDVAADDGALPAFANADAMDWLAVLPFNNATGVEIAEAFDAVGVEEIQSRLQAAATADVEPNLQHNEGATAGLNVAELEMAGLSNIAVVPTFGGVDGLSACTTETATYPVATLPDADGNATTIDATFGQRLNTINDSFESGECHLVVALGFGHDAAHSTTGSSVAISTAPTFISNNINPNEQYARYIALFHVGADDDGDGIIQDAEIFNQARLVAVVDTEGNVIDEAISAATDETAN